MHMHMHMHVHVHVHVDMHMFMCMHMLCICCGVTYLGARARAGVIFLLSAYSLSYLISIYRRCFCQGVWPVRAVQRAAGATATGPCRGRVCP